MDIQTWIQRNIFKLNKKIIQAFSWLFVAEFNDADEDFSTFLMWKKVVITSMTVLLTIGDA